MAQITVTLVKGISVGGVAYREAILREPTALDVVEATEAAERCVTVPVDLDGNGEAILMPQLLTSPTATGIGVLLRQIVSIGPMKAPFDRVLLSSLSPEDLDILQEEAKKLDTARLDRARREVALRGRTDSAGEGDS